MYGKTCYLVETEMLFEKEKELIKYEFRIKQFIKQLYKLNLN